MLIYKGWVPIKTCRDFKAWVWWCYREYTFVTIPDVGYTFFRIFGFEWRTYNKEEIEMSNQRRADL